MPPVIEILRWAGMAVATIFTLYTAGPPAIAVVDHYGLKTIGFMADAILAVAPQPPPLTASLPTQPPVAAQTPPVVFKTILTEQGGTNARPTPVEATITGANHGQWTRADGGSSQHGDGPYYWTCTIFQFPRRILLCLRQLLDHWLFQLSLMLAPVATWRLLSLHSQRNMERIAALTELEVFAKDQKAAARNLDLASLQSLLELQRQALSDQTSRLDETRRNLELKELAERELKAEVAGLKLNLTAADQRANTAKRTIDTLEKRAKQARSDHSSAVQKKDNEVSAQKRSLEEAVKERDSARHELREARALGRENENQVTELRKQVTNSGGQISELQAQVRGKDSSLYQRDNAAKKLQGEKDRALKEARGWAAQTKEAKKNRDAAEAKASRQEKLADEATKQRKAAETNALERENWAARELKSKDDKIASDKEDYNASYQYLQRQLNAAGASNEKLQATLTTERAEAKEAAKKAQETEGALEERMAELEKQLRERSASSNTEPPSSRAASLAASPSSRPHPVALFHVRPGPRFVPPPNGTTNTPPEKRGLSATTPTGPRALSANTATGPRRFPSNTPTESKAGRGGGRSGRGSGRGGL